MVPNLSRKIFGLVACTALALFGLFAFELNMGLDLAGGARIVYGFDFEEAVEEGTLDEQDLVNKQMLLEQMATIFLKRVDPTGTQNISIYPQGEDQLVLELPDFTEDRVAEIKQLMVNQGLLDFRIVAAAEDDVGLNAERRKWRDWKAANPEGSPLQFNQVPESEGGPRDEIRWVAVGEDTRIPQDRVTEGAVPLLMMDAVHPERAGGDSSWEFSGGDVQYVGPAMDPRGMPAVRFEMTDYRQTPFADFTETYQGRLMAIVLNNEVHSAPNINQRLPGGGIIEGGMQGFDQEEVRQLVTVLRTGSLRVLPQLESESYVGPALGEDAIRTGVRSALIGALIVLVFMIAYYRINGVVATLALAFNGFLIVGALYFFQATLTLPGLAGLVLTIGMAVDANILVFERVREEWRRGRETPQAYKNGYERAFSTIMDANVTTGITALILYLLGTGPVKGFAAVLLIGILTTLFSVLVFSKVVMNALVFGRKKTLQKVSMAKAVAADTHIRFLAKRKVAASISVGLIIGGMVLYGSVGDRMLGIDFAGGSTATVKLDREVSITELRERVPEYQVTMVQGERGGDGDLMSDEFQLKKKLTAEERRAQAAAEAGGGAEAPPDPATEMLEELATALGDWLPKEAAGGIDYGEAFPQTATVGARVSGEIQSNAVRAILISLIAIVVYMTFRFKEYRYGLAAVAALFHDVLFTLGALALAYSTGLVHVEINLEIIAAFLTIIGYSLNDTIVVFDRIRENLPRRKESFAEIIDISINQSLSRTILTSITTFVVVGVLFVANRPFHNVLEGFSFAMLVGVVIGTYSSMFVASPLLLFFDRWARDRKIESIEDAAKRRAREARKGAQPGPASS